VARAQQMNPSFATMPELVSDLPKKYLNGELDLKTRQKVLGRKTVSSILLKACMRNHCKGAGVLLKAKLGDTVEGDGVLLEIYAERNINLQSALGLAERLQPIVLSKKSQQRAQARAYNACSFYSLLLLNH
jgi:hypothetical protein